MYQAADAFSSVLVMAVDGIEAANADRFTPRSADFHTNQGRHRMDDTAISRWPQRIKLSNGASSIPRHPRSRAWLPAARSSSTLFSGEPPTCR